MPMYSTGDTRRGPVANILLSSFLDGFTGGSLVTRLRRPGAPTQVFADEDSNYPQKELISSLLDEEQAKARDVAGTETKAALGAR
jgi:hypothetical protein